MAPKVTNEQISTRLEHLEIDLDCFDKAVVETGVVASRALARTEALEAMISIALKAAGVDGATDDVQASYSDPVALRMQEARRKAEERRQRIEASGLRLIAGGGAS